MVKSYCSIEAEDFEIRLSGSGGQGLISAGMTLSEAIGLGDGKNVVQTQSYGPEARGGATRCDVIVSEGEIYFPECNKYDLFLALTQQAYESYSKNIKRNGIIIIDQDAVEAIGESKAVSVPFISTAVKKFGNAIVANMIALGFISEYTGIVKKKSIKWAVERRFKDNKHLDSNLAALDAGFQLAKLRIKAEEDREKAKQKKKA